MDIESLKNKLSLSLLPIIIFIQTPIVWVKTLAAIYIVNVFLFNNIFGFWLEKHFGHFKFNKKIFYYFFILVLLYVVFAIVQHYFFR
jgi:hypothetical protein